MRFAALLLVILSLFAVSSASGAPQRGMLLGFVWTQVGVADSVYLANVDGTHQRVVLHGKRVGKCAALRYDNPAWSRRGALAVTEVTNENCASHDWWTVAVLPRGAKRLIGLGTGHGNSSAGSWAPDDQRIVVAGQMSPYQPLFILRASKPQPITSPLKSSERLGCWDPSWSPDGKTIAFAAEQKTGYGYDLYLTDASGENLRRLTTNAQRPSWSPDSRRLVFDNGHGLYTIRADGTGMHRLYQPKGKAAIDPAWSPDGKRIAFSVGHSVWIIKATGGPPRAVVKNATQPTWKP